MKNAQSIALCWMNDERDVLLALWAMWSQPPRKGRFHPPIAPTQMQSEVLTFVVGIVFDTSVLLAFSLNKRDMPGLFG